VEVAFLGRAFLCQVLVCFFNFLWDIGDFYDTVAFVANAFAEMTLIPRWQISPCSKQLNLRSNGHGWGRWT